MHAEVFDPRVEPVPVEWRMFLKEERISSAWDSEALTALAWCSQRTVLLGMVFDGDRAVALFCGDFGSVRRRRPRYAAPDRLPVVGFFFSRILMGFNEGFAFAGSLDEPSRIAARTGFERALRARLGRRCVGVVYQNVPRSHLGSVNGRRRLCRPVSPNAVLRNRWDSMDGYFAHLPRDRRRRFRRIWTELGGARDLRIMTGIGEIDPEQAAELEQWTRAKHLRRGEVLVPLPSRYFDRLNRKHGVRYFAHQARDTGRLLSFDLGFEAGQHLITTVTGTRTDDRRGLYHHLYLREIAFMIDCGLDAVEFGKGMLDLKQRFGAAPEPQYAIVAHL